MNDFKNLPPIKLNVHTDVEVEIPSEFALAMYRVSLEESYKGAGQAQVQLMTAFNDIWQKAGQQAFNQVAEAVGNAFRLPGPGSGSGRG